MIRAGLWFASKWVGWCKKKIPVVLPSASCGSDLRGVVFFCFSICVHSCCFFSLLTVATYIFCCFSAASLLPSVWGHSQRFFFWIEYLCSRRITLIFELTYLKTKKEKIKIWRTLKKLTACAAMAWVPASARQAVACRCHSHATTHQICGVTRLHCGPVLQGWNAQQTETFAKRSSPTSCRR